MSGDLNSIVCNRTKSILDEGGTSLMMSVRTAKSVDIVFALQAAGYDAFYADLEHGTLTMPEAGQLCTMALAVGVTGFVRIPSHDSHLAAQALDGGAMGVVVPHMETAAQAKAMADACLYPPQGHRSASSTIPQLRFRRWPVVQARQRINEQTMVVPQIESRLGVANAADIAAVDGVAMLLLGCNDLSADLGIPGEFENECLIDSIGQVIAAGQQHQKPVGIAGVSGPPAVIQRLYRLGARLFSLGTDSGHLLNSATRQASEARELFTTT